MVASENLASAVEQLILTRAGLHALVTTISPIDHPIYGETVFRVTFDSAVSPRVNSAIVKRKRAAGSWRSDQSLLLNEIAALQFLAEVSPASAPHLIAADAAGMIVMEDLGYGPSLEDVLFGQQRGEASTGLLAFATALGEMHAATAGTVEAYHRRRERLGQLDLEAERRGIFEQSLGAVWRSVRAAIEERPELPIPFPAIDTEIAGITALLEAPGPWLVLAHGDPCPANTRLAHGNVRFLDFEHAGYRHGLLDVTALHLPFPACPCWSLIPPTIAANAIAVYRHAFARNYPQVLNDEVYYPHAATTCLTWAIQRLRGLPKRDAFDEPHPVGFSRRGQLISTVRAAGAVAQRAGAFPKLATWMNMLGLALEQRWSDAPMNRPLFPAFAAESHTTES